jgi:hypothetical protein
MSTEKRSGSRRQAMRGSIGGDSRDGPLGPDAEAPAPSRPVVDARGRTIVTPNGFLLRF